jgi:hypothetical protein
MIMVFTRGLNSINKLRPVALNFGKDLLVSSKIQKGSCSVIPDTGLFLLEEATSDSGSSQLTEADWAVRITLSLLRNIFLAIIIF